MYESVQIKRILKDILASMVNMINKSTIELIKK